MRRKHRLMVPATILFFAAMTSNAESPIAVAIHGGAGTISRSTVTPEMENAIREKLTEAARAAYRVLEDNGESVDAVTAAVRILEDSPYFNAGKGAVFTWDGENELDASIMDGRTLNAGAVSGVRNIANPILLARKVMDDSPHVFLSGRGAEQFALEQGMASVPDDYFYTERRWQQLLKMKKDQGLASSSPSFQIGTVGAVALDREGNLAAATSTGGTTGKRYGRIGDSPIIGAGTYANNRSVAVSATGAGEFFIRGTVAHDIAALVEYRELSLAEAAHEVVIRKLGDLKGTGGVIAIDRNGNISMPFNTEGMYRAAINNKGNLTILLYRQTSADH